jgi:osmotically-inducible protein OsmY
MRVRTNVGMAVIGLAVLSVACENTREGLEKDAQANRPKVERAAEQTAAATREAAQEIKKAAGPAAEQIRESTAKAAQAAREQLGGVARVADAAQQTAQVKAALMADASVDSTTIDVDTQADTRTVVLKGHVRSEAEKATAGRIAAAQAAGFRIDNRLAVRP